MRQTLISLLSGILILTACVPETAERTRLPSPSETPTILPPATFTPSPTPIPPTQTITPLPTIPTFTPTFDTRTIVTVTPAAKAECPKEDSSVIAKFATPNAYGSHEFYGVGDILAYLNSGGPMAPLGKSSAGTKPDANGRKIVDLTGDGLNEIVYDGIWRYDILGCKDGKYESLFGLEPNGVFSIDLEEVLDLNKNGIPELIFYNFDHYGAAEVYIVEWNGSKFRSMINVGIDITTGTVIDSVYTTAYYKLIDTNGDGLKEIILEDNPHVLENVSGLTIWLLIPFRSKTVTLGWNGKNFVNLKPENYAPTEYRFQAIQDGDTASSQREYGKALSLYQEAIFSDKLKSYSPETRDNLRAQWDARYGTTATPTTNPIALDEYPKLATYAYYRIVLLHLVQNRASDAKTIYSTLQQKFGNDPYGHPYVEMATAFWNAYQSTHKMYDGCAAAIQYAVEHSEILIPLGSDYHGGYSHIYAPAAVCPFR